LATKSSSPSDRAAPAAAAPDFTTVIEQRDFLDVHVAALSPKIRSALIAWSNGQTNQEIADSAGVSEAAVRKWIAAGIAQIRSILTEN
jgi:DNA-directed RNA polymerase specialized sigma24 family protein